MMDINDAIAAMKAPAAPKQGRTEVLRVVTLSGNALELWLDLKDGGVHGVKPDGSTCPASPSGPRGFGKIEIGTGWKNGRKLPIIATVKPEYVAAVDALFDKARSIFAETYAEIEKEVEAMLAEDRLR